jgi:undecaprenyl-diphosphatase
MADPLARLQRLNEQELLWCLRFNQAARKRSIERLFAVVSHLGDGIFWYGLMACLMLIDGLAALPAVGHMLTAGAVGLVLYRWLKTKTTRPRPCDHNLLIRAAVAPLDKYSFPSGHTLHAVSFSLAATFHYPRLAWLVIPFTGLVAVSRLVLGLHYPSDVLAGALLGAGLATLVLQF